MSVKVFVLKHPFTKTYYGFKPISTNMSSYNLQIGYEHNDPKFNIVCFKKKDHANIVNKSISTHRSVYNEYPTCDKICVYPDNILVTESTDSECIMDIIDISLDELVNTTKKRNLGVFMLLEIEQNDNKITIEGKELIHNSFLNDEYGNYRDVLEHDLKLKLKLKL